MAIHNCQFFSNTGFIAGQKGNSGIAMTDGAIVLGRHI